MTTYHFLEHEALARIAELRRGAERHKLALLAQGARDRRQDFALAAWFSALFAALAERARLPVRRESALAKIRHFLRALPGITSDRRSESP